MIEFWMKIHLASDNSCNAVIYNPQKNYKEWQINVGLTFSVGDTIPWFTISIEQDN